MPQDDLTKLRETLRAIRARYQRTAPLEEERPADVPPPINNDVPGNPFRPVRTDMPEGARPLGASQPIITRADAPDARTALAGKMDLLLRGGQIKRSLGSLEAGLEVGMATAPFNAVRAVTPVQSWRDKLDRLSEGSISPTLGEDMERGGGDPESFAFKAGAIAPALAAAAVTQGGAISALGAALRGSTSMLAARTSLAGVKAMDRVLNAQRATALGQTMQRMVPGAAISAGVTAATVGPNDQNLLFDKGRGGAVAEDLLFSAVPMAASGAIGQARAVMARNKVGRQLNIDNPKAAINADVRAINAAVDRPRLTSGVPSSGVIDAPADPNGRVLITPPPKETSPGAFPVLTDGEAMERVNILRKRGESYKSTVGVDPATGQHIDPTKQAVIDFQGSVRDGQERVATREAEIEAGRRASEQAARDASDPRKMSMRDLLAQARNQGLQYGAIGAASYNADNIREMLGQERRNDSTTDGLLGGTLAGAVFAGSLRTPAGRKAFKGFSRLEEAVKNLPETVNASDLLKRLPNMVNKGEMDARGVTSLLEQAKAGQRKVSRSEIESLLAASPNPVKEPGAFVRGHDPSWGNDPEGTHVDTDAAKFGQFVDRGPADGYRETVLTTPDVPGEKGYGKIRSTHFPSDQNYGAHTRTQDRETVDGESVLHVVERQSDNFQALRDEERQLKEAGVPLDEIDDPDVADRLRALGKGSSMRETWSLDTIKSAIDDAVRMGKRFITMNSGEDIYPAISSGGKERVAALESDRRAFEGQLQYNADNPRAVADIRKALAKTDEELAKHGKMRGGLNRFYGEETDAALKKWEQQHGMKLVRKEITLQGMGRTVDWLDSEIARVQALRDKAFGDPLDEAKATQKLGELQAERADVLAGGRKAMAIEITPELRELIETKGQALNAMAPVAGLAGAGAAGDEDLTTEQRLGGAALAVGAMGRGKNTGRIAVEIARRARLKAGKLRPGDLPDASRPHVAPPAQRGAEGFGNMRPSGPVDTRDFANYDARWQELKNDPAGKLALDRRIADLAQNRGATFKETVTFDDVRANATRLGLDAEQLVQAAKKRNLSPAEQLAASDVVAQNMDNIVEYEKRLSDPAVPAGEKESIQRALGALESQTNELLWANITERTEAGRNLVFQKIAATRTMDPQFWLSRAAKNMGNIEKVSIEHIATINDFVAKKDRAGLASYVASLKPGRGARIVTTLYKAGLLTNPATHATNVASNALMAGAETAKDAPAAVADRALTALLNAAIGSGAGGTVARSRDFSSAAVKASWKGAQEGARSVKATLKGQDAPSASQLGKYDQVEEVRTGNVIADTYMNGPFRLLRASDNVFREAAFFRALEQQRRLAGMPAAKDIREAVASASGDMVSRAVADAEIATFQNSSMLGKVGSNVKNAMASAGGEGGRIAGEILLPFTKTPGAVASSVVRYSPLGLARGLTDAVILVQKATKARAKGREIAQMAGSGASASEIRFTSEQLHEQVKVLQELKNATVDRLGRGTVGTGVMALGALMAMNGMLTVKPGRTDRSGRDTGEVLGDPGNTIDFGPLNAQIDRLSPLGNLLLLGAYAVKGYNEENPKKLMESLAAKTQRTPDEELQYRALKQQRDEEGPRLIEGTWGTAIAATLGAIGNTIVEQPVFSGVKRVEDVLADPVKATQKAMYAQAASVIPAGVAAVARTVDPNRRETETLGETMRSRVPGVSKGVPEKLDALGTPIRESLAVRVANLVSPMRLSADRTVGTSDDAKVRKVLADLDIPLSRVSQRTKDGETISQAHHRQSVVGDNILRRVAAIVPTLDQLPLDQRADYIKLQIGRARDAGNRLAKRDRRQILFADQDAFDGRP